jgi:hypothetical protein
MTRGISKKEQRADLRRKRAAAAAGLALGGKKPPKPFSWYRRSRSGRQRAALGLRWAGGTSDEFRARASPPRRLGGDLAPRCLSRPWRARIFIAGRNVHLGYFSSAEEARAAHAEAVKACLGERYLKAEDLLRPGCWMLGPSLDPDWTWNGP